MFIGRSVILFQNNTMFKLGIFQKYIATATFSITTYTRTLFSRGLRDSISHSVCLLVRRSVRRSVHHTFTFQRFVSGFCITAPAQLHETVAVMYTASLTAPALQITAPAQSPWLMVSCIRPCSFTGLRKRLNFIFQLASILAIFWQFFSKSQPFLPPNDLQGACERVPLSFYRL